MPEYDNTGYIWMNNICANGCVSSLGAYFIGQRLVSGDQVRDTVGRLMN